MAKKKKEKTTNGEQADVPATSLEPQQPEERVSITTKFTKTEVMLLKFIKAKEDRLQLEVLSDALREYAIKYHQDIYEDIVVSERIKSGRS